MSVRILFDFLLIVGFAAYGLVPFTNKRIRAPWAKKVFIVSSVVGVARGAVGLAWDLGWLRLGAEEGVPLDNFLSMIGGLLLGFIFSLIFSGQLVGRRQDFNCEPAPNPHLQPTPR